MEAKDVKPEEATPQVVTDESKAVEEVARVNEVPEAKA